MMEAATVADTQSIKLLHLPTVSRTLAKKFYAPMAAELQQNIGRELQLLFPASYCETIRQAQNPTQEFDLVFPPPHLSGQLTRDKGYIPLVYLTQKIQGNFIYKVPHSKGNYKVALGDKYATITFEAKQQMKDILEKSDDLKDLAINDLQYIYHLSHNGAMMALLKGEVDAAVVPEFIFKSTSSMLKNNYQRVKFISTYPGAIILANAKLSSKVLQSIKEGFTISEGRKLLPLNFRAVDDAYLRKIMAMPDVDISECTEGADNAPPLFQVGK